jgi:hypothetical protein
MDALAASCCAPTLAEDGPAAPQDHPWRSSRCQSGTFWAHPPGAELHPALVNGGSRGGDHRTGPDVSHHGFTVADGKIIQIDAIADPDRVRRIAVAVLSDDKVAALQMPRGSAPASAACSLPESAR